MDGMEWTEMERNGMDGWNGMEGMENGLNLEGMEWNGMEITKLRKIDFSRNKIKHLNQEKIQTSPASI